MHSSGVSTDTRKIQQNQIFFALKGPNFDANKMAGEALRKGARLAVVDDPQYATSSKTFLVEDSLEALQALARQHRNELSIPILALTGSNGKTTTKELLREVLSTRYRTFATSGNLNNHIGVPLSILSINKQHEIAIIEMGANHVGEIASLCTIAKPDHGLITNIGKAHIGEFGGFENIIRGKSELFDHLRKEGGTVFINTHDKVLQNMAKRFPEAQTYPEGNFTISFENADPFVTFKTASGTVIHTHLLGKYNFINIAAALCVGYYFQCDDDAMLQAIQNYVPSNNRSQVVKAGTNTIIMDAYNANPSSMEEAVKSFADMKEDHKMVILGDMLELGEDTHAEHFNLGHLVKELGISQAIYVGPLMKSAIEAHSEGLYFEKKDDLLAYLEQHTLKDHHILIKGSRGMALESILEKING